MLRCRSVTKKMAEVDALVESITKVEIQRNSLATSVVVPAAAVATAADGESTPVAEQPLADQARSVMQRRFNVDSDASAAVLREFMVGE